MFDKLINSNKAFTLIEILVALALISVVGVGATQFLDGSFGFFNFAQESLDQSQEVQDAINQIAYDLSQAENFEIEDNELIIDNDKRYFIGGLGGESLVLENLNTGNSETLIQNNTINNLSLEFQEKINDRDYIDLDLTIENEGIVKNHSRNILLTDDGGIFYDEEDVQEGSITFQLANENIFDGTEVKLIDSEDEIIDSENINSGESYNKEIDAKLNGYFYTLELTNDNNLEDKEISFNLLSDRNTNLGEVSLDTTHAQIEGNSEHPIEISIEETGQSWSFDEGSFELPNVKTDIDTQEYTLLFESSLRQSEELEIEVDAGDIITSSDYSELEDIELTPRVGEVRGVLRTEIYDYDDDEEEGTDAPSDSSATATIEIIDEDGEVVKDKEVSGDESGESFAIENLPTEMNSKNYTFKASANLYKTIEEDFSLEPEDSEFFDFEMETKDTTVTVESEHEGSFSLLNEEENEDEINNFAFYDSLDSFSIANNDLLMASLNITNISERVNEFDNKKSLGRNGGTIKYENVPTSIEGEGYRLAVESDYRENALLPEDNDFGEEIKAYPNSQGGLSSKGGLDLVDVIGPVERTPNPRDVEIRLDHSGEITILDEFGEKWESETIGEGGGTATFEELPTGDSSDNVEDDDYEGAEYTLVIESDDRFKFEEEFNLKTPEDESDVDYDIEDMKDDGVIPDDEVQYGHGFGSERKYQTNANELSLTYEPVDFTVNTPDKGDRTRVTLDKTGEVEDGDNVEFIIKVPSIGDRARVTLD